MILRTSISVIICSYTMERYEDTINSVNSVLAQTLKPLEVILSVDNNEELFKLFESEFRSEVKVVINQGIVGSAETRNMGIRSAEGEIIAFIDDDATAKENWLEELVKPYCDTDVMATGGRIISTWNKGRPFWFPEELDWIVGGTYKGYVETQTQIRNTHWPNMSFRRRVCEQVGFVRTDIGALGNTSRSGDETELCMRITHHIPFAKIVHCPEAIVYHQALPSHSNLRAYFGRAFNEGKYKAQNRDSFAALSKQPLSAENSYLRYLLVKSLPSRFKTFYRKNNVPQIGAIIISIITTGLGYLAGWAKLAR